MLVGTCCSELSGHMAIEGESPKQARAYKPDHQLFRHAHSAIGITPGRPHVDTGQVTGLKVCHELVIRAVWINRLGETLNPD